MSLLRAESLSLTRHGRQILNDVSLSLESGKILTLIGPNGAGKTSLVRCLLGLSTPDSGRVEKAPDLRTGYMPQKLHLDPSLPLSVKRFLQMGCTERTSSTAFSLQLAPLAELTGIGDLLESPIQSLSGGETQRVLLTRALIRNPHLLVLDEPVQGVDMNGQAQLYQLIHRIRNERQCGVLLVSHDLHLVMATTDEVICLNQHVCCHGHPEQVTSDPAYLSLFGSVQATTQAQMAIYTHHHDHSHDTHGNIVKGQGKRSAGCDHHHV